MDPELCCMCVQYDQDIVDLLTSLKAGSVTAEGGMYAAALPVPRQPKAGSAHALPAFLEAPLNGLEVCCAVLCCAVLCCGHQNKQLMQPCTLKQASGMFARCMSAVFMLHCISALGHIVQWSVHSPYLIA